MNKRTLDFVSGLIVLAAVVVIVGCAWILSEGQTLPPPYSDSEVRRSTPYLGATPTAAVDHGAYFVVDYPGRVVMVYCVGDVRGVADRRRDCFEPDSGSWIRLAPGQPARVVDVPEFYLPPPRPPAEFVDTARPVLPLEWQYRIVNALVKLLTGVDMDRIDPAAESAPAPEGLSSAELRVRLGLSQSQISRRAARLGIVPVRVLRGRAWTPVYSPDEVQRIRNYAVAPGWPKRKGGRE